MPRVKKVNSSMKRYINLPALLACLLLMVGCSHTPVAPITTTRPATEGTETGPSSGDKDAVKTSVDIIDPEMLEQYKTALSLMADEKFSRAEKILQKIIDDHPELAGPYVNIGIIYQKTDKTSEAEDAFKQAIEDNPENVIARNQLGILYRKSGRFDEALQMYNKALEIDPQYANAHLNLGILYDLYLDKPEMALTQYQRYLELINEEDKQVELWIADIKNRIKQPPPQTAENQP